MGNSASYASRLQREYRRNTVHGWLIGLGILALLGFIVAVFGFIGQGQWEDFETGTSHKGIGYILRQSIGSSSRYTGGRIYYNVQIQVPKQVLRVRMNDPIPDGTPVWVAYRVGKSGGTYVERVTPMPRP